MSPRLPRSLATLALVASLASLSGSALRADDRTLALRVWTLRLPGNELGCEAGDLDGDGDLDLAVAHMSEPTGEGRSISFYLQGPRASRFGDAPARRVEVPSDACAFFVADLDPAPGSEVGLLCPGRVLLVRLDGTTRELLGEPGFFDYPERGGLPVWDLVRDLDGDGRPELLVPTKQGYRVVGCGADGSLAVRGELRLELDQRFGPAFETKLLNRFLTATLRLRRVVTTDLDADGRQDLIAVSERGLARYLQRPDGSFPPQPDREDPFQITRGKDDPEGGKGGGFASLRLNLADVDGDGRADLLATRTLGEVGMFSSLRTQQLVFLARADLSQTWDERRPAAVINLKGISDDPLLIDWDGDGKRDLVVSTYRMDMLSNVKRALVDSLTITYLIFLQRQGAEPFAADPDVSLDVEVPLESLQERGGTRAVIFTADLDGDGVRDQVARRADGALQIARGRVERDGAEAELSFGEPQRLTIPRTEPPWVRDLDGDGRDELILEPFAGEDGEARTLRVVGVAE